MSRQTMIEMAESYLWRGEIERHQFMMVAKVLVGLGWLKEDHLEHIHDDLDELYPQRSSSKSVADTKEGKALLTLHPPGAAPVPAPAPPEASA